MKTYDIAVIGGGASGLTAAISAARENPELSIAVIERLSRVGKKILATGNGRCNFTNVNISINNYHGSCAKLYNSISDFDCKIFFEELGVLGYADDEFRVYPLNNNASAVLDALRLETEKNGIEIICDFAVSDIKKEKNAYRIFSGDNLVTAKSVIVAGGGMSQANLGSDGSVLRILKKHGVKISPLSPALTAFKVKADAVRSLKGIRTNGIVTLYENQKKLGSEQGEVQFGDGAISGICIFNLSCLAAGKENLAISVNMLPQMSFNDAHSYISKLCDIRKNAPLEELLSGIINKRIGINVIKNATTYPLTEKASILKEKDIKNITSEIMNFKFDITGLAGFEKSQVTAGGVHISEVDPCFRSLKYGNMYFCGEILDIVGDCGGFNLNFAFGSGFLAGRTCAEDLK